MVIVQIIILIINNCEYGHDICTVITLAIIIIIITIVMLNIDWTQMRLGC